MKKFLFAWGLIALMAAGAQADTEYDCIFNKAEMAPSGEYNLIVIVDSQTGKVSTWDGFSNNDKNGARHKAQPQVDVKRRSDGGMIFSWLAEDVRFDSYSSDISYRVRIESGGTMDATISWLSYPPSLHYTGQCVARKGEFSLS